MGILGSSICLIAMTLYVTYFLKARKLGKTLSSKTNRMNTMLFRALNIQFLIVEVTWATPGLIIGAVLVLRFEYASFIAQICLFFPLFYPIFEILALLYFVTPYRNFIKGCLDRILLKIGMKKVMPNTSPYFINNTIAQGLHK
jgi:hypothetical protein